MELVATDDPVYVVDLTAPALAACRADLDDGDTNKENTREDDSREGTDPISEPPERPIRAVAFLLDGYEEPVLIPIPPTRDVEALDAMARLIRAAVVTGVEVSRLARQYGDSRLRALYGSRRLPAFVYEPPPWLPPWLAAVLR